MDKDKVLRRGLFWFGLAIICAIWSSASTNAVWTVIAFTFTIIFAFLAYLFLEWEN